MVPKGQILVFVVLQASNFCPSQHQNTTGCGELIGCDDGLTTPITRPENFLEGTHLLLKEQVEIYACTHSCLLEHGSKSNKYPMSHVASADYVLQ